MGQNFKAKICSSRSKFFSITVDPFQGVTIYRVANRNLCYLIKHYFRKISGENLREKIEVYQTNKLLKYAKHLQASTQRSVKQFTVLRGNILTYNMGTCIYSDSIHCGSSNVVVSLP